MYKVTNLDDNGAQDITLQLPDAPVVGQAFSGDVLWTSQDEGMVWQTLQNPVVQAIPGPNVNQWASYRIKGTRPDNNANIFFYLTDVTQNSGDMRMEVHAPNWSQRWFDQGVEPWGNEYQHTFQLKGHWRFESDASDSVGSNNGSVTGAAFSEGHIAFDGSNDFFTIPHDDAHSFDGDFSVSMWINTTTTAKSCIWLKSQQAGGNNSNHSVFINQSSYAAGVPVYSFGHSGAVAYVNVAGTTAINDGNWHQVTITKSGSTVKLLVDGALEGQSSSATGAFSATRDLEVGRWNHDSHPDQFYFTGNLDDFRIWSRALSGVEASALYDAGRDPAAPADISTGLVSRWSFESDASDSVGDNDLNMGNGAAADGVLSLPNYNSAAYPSSPTALGQSYTISIWFKNMRDRSTVQEGFTMLTGTSGGGGSNGSHAGNFGSYDLSVYTNDELGVWSSGDNWVSSGYAMTYDNFTGWHNIIAAYSGEHTSFYIDGNKVGQDVQWGGSSDIETFGAWLNYNYTFAEELDDIRVYSRALSAVDASALYDAGRDPSEAPAGGGFSWNFDGQIQGVEKFISGTDSSGSKSYAYLCNENGATRLWIGSDITDFGTFSSVDPVSSGIVGAPMGGCAGADGHIYLYTDANIVYKVSIGPSASFVSTEQVPGNYSLKAIRYENDSLIMACDDGRVMVIVGAAPATQVIDLSSQYSAGTFAIDVAGAPEGWCIISRNSDMTFNATIVSSDWNFVYKNAQLSIPISAIEINYYPGEDLWKASDGTSVVQTDDITSWLT